MAVPVIGFAGGLPCVLSQITGGAFWPCLAGPWKWAIVVGLDSPL